MKKSKKEEVFGEYLKKLRLERDFGLRRFAGLTSLDPSYLSNIERGKIPPPRSREILGTIAEALSLAEADPEYGRLFDLSVADRPERLPGDVAKKLGGHDLIPVLLRTIGNKKMTRKQMMELIKTIEENY